MLRHLTHSYKPKNCSWYSSSHGLKQPTTAHVQVTLERVLWNYTLKSSPAQPITFISNITRKWSKNNISRPLTLSMYDAHKVPFSTLTSLRWITIISYDPARLGFQSHSPFLVSAKGPPASRVSLSDVCRMLTCLSHVPLFTRSTRGRTQQPNLQHPKENEAVREREREVHKDRYCLDQGQDPLSTEWDVFLKSRGWKWGRSKESEREGAWKQRQALLKNKGCYKDNKVAIVGDDNIWIQAQHVQLS